MGVSMHGVDGQPQPWVGTQGRRPYMGSLGSGKAHIWQTLVVGGWCLWLEHTHKLCWLLTPQILSHCCSISAALTGN